MGRTAFGALAQAFDIPKYERKGLSPPRDIFR
jgi:hypothetical protein